MALCSSVAVEHIASSERAKRYIHIHYMYATVHKNVSPTFNTGNAPTSGTPYNCAETHNARCMSEYKSELVGAREIDTYTEPVGSRIHRTFSLLLTSKQSVF